MKWLRSDRHISPLQSAVIPFRSDPHDSPCLHLSSFILRARSSFILRSTVGILAKEIEATYEILEKMGEGVMGAVYKARHRFFDEIRVIKVMQAQLASTEELRERSRGEAKRGKQLRHPNLAEVFDFSVAADGTSYIVMEYIEGVTLRDIMKRTGGPLGYKT